LKYAQTILSIYLCGRHESSPAKTNNGYFCELSYLSVQPILEIEGLRVTVTNDFARKKFRVLIVDDDDMTRFLLKNLFLDLPQIEIIGEAPDGETAIKLTDKLMPDAVILDVRMPHMSGVDASRLIHSAHPEIRVIALSVFEEEEMGREMQDAGAVGYFCKNEPWNVTVNGIHHMLASLPIQQN